MSISPVAISAHNPGPLTGPGNATYLLIARDRRALLVDAGVGDPRHLREIDERLAAEGAHLAAVVVTHAHPDHASGAPALARAHPAAVFYKYPWPPEDARYDLAWQPLADGDVMPIEGEQLVVLHTPGHSPDHVALWDEGSRAVFTGDLVIPGGSVMIHTGRGGDMIQYLESLQRVRALRPIRLLPAHGPERHDAVDVLTAHLEHRLDRERQVVEALSAGRATVESIVESIYDGLAGPLVDAARENVRAHLEKLRIEGRAVEHRARWTSNEKL
jgi:glyoxylase-like metal-dependent hydrolase (beta-lactamase superfamily II)